MQSKSNALKIELDFDWTLNLIGVVSGMEGHRSDPTFDYIRRKNWRLRSSLTCIFRTPFTDVSAIPYWVTRIAKALSARVQRHISNQCRFWPEKGNNLFGRFGWRSCFLGKPFISKSRLPKRFELGAELAGMGSVTPFTPRWKGATQTTKFTRIKSIIFQKADNPDLFL